MSDFSNLPSSTLGSCVTRLYWEVRVFFFESFEEPLEVFSRSLDVVVAWLSLESEESVGGEDGRAFFFCPEVSVESTLSTTSSWEPTS